MNYIFTFFSLFLMIWGIIQLVEMYKRSRYNPQVGDILCRSNAKDNPFDRIELVVVAVKDGWVQYSFHPVDRHSGTYSDRLSSIREFYTKIN